MNKTNVLAVSAVILASATAVALIKKKSHPPLEVAPYVDLNKYLGEWYEIARLPTRFEKGCYDTKAYYSLRKDGSISVVNTCRKGSVNGKLDKAQGKATIADPTSNAKLKVQFFWPFKGDYWILDVGKNYEYALVGEPSRENFWILSRSPHMDKELLRELMLKAEDRGFDTGKLIFTKHK